jgi:tetratricopeptide (TPR) repeat protein
MPTKRRGSYPYRVQTSYARQAPRRPPAKKKKRRPLRSALWVLLLLLVVGALVLIFRPAARDAVISFMPFPKNLAALRLLHNGKEVILLPGSQCVLNPRDSIQILEVQTDGWRSWGTRVEVEGLDVSPLRKGPVAIKDLMPQESFETPKTIEIQALWLGRPIGKVSFLVQLDAKDWLQKANAASKVEQKIAYLEKALKENPGNVLVKTQLAGVYFENKKYDPAAKLYEEIDESGKSKTILERLLLAYQARNRVDEALKTYLDLFKLSDDADTFKEFLQYLQKHKSKEDALKFLEKHQQDFPRSFQSSTLLLLADLSAQTKNWSKASSAYERAIKAGVKDPDVLYNLAVTYQHGEDSDKATQALERYLQKNPNDIKSWMQLGEMQEKRGALVQAKTTYETVLQKNPQHKDALLKLLHVLEKTKDKAGLQTTYEKLAQIQPKNRTIQHNLGVLYYESKKWDKAAQCFESIASSDARDVESRKYLLDIYRKTKNEKGEAEMLGALAQLDPKNTSYYEAIFSSYDQKKDFKGMLTFFKNAVQHHPDSITVRNYLLYAQLKLGDNKAALKELDELSRLQPKEKKFLRQAANLCETSGDYAGALKKLDLLLKLDPKDKEAKDDYLRIKLLMVTKKKAA